MMALTDGVDIAAQPYATEGASAITFTLGDSRLLQQRQGAAACSDKDEFGRHGYEAPIIGVLDRHAPASVVFAVQTNNLAIIVKVKAGLIGQVFDEQVSKGAIVDVGAGDDAGCRERLLVTPPVHDQRRPLCDFGAVLAVLHAVIAVVGGHFFEAPAQELDSTNAPDEAHVRAWVYESARVGDCALFD